MRVLVVDDEKLLRETLGRQLRQAGFEAIVADSGSAALVLLEHTRFDVVLTDLVMPQMSGIELLCEIRRRHISTEVLLMSATPRADTAADAVTLGAAGYLTKPFRFAALVAQLERLKTLHQVRQQLVEMQSFDEGG